MNNKYKSNNTKKSDPPSTILLVIITQIPPQIPLTNDSLHQTFSPFGNVQKVLIFERGKVNKAFVQFQELKQAILARQRLNLSYLFKQFGKMHIHYSKLQNLDLQTVEHTRGSDFKHSSYYDDFILDSSNSLSTQQQKERVITRGQKIGILHNQNTHHPIQYSKTDEPRSLNTQLRELRLGEFSLKDIINETSPTDIHYQNEFGDELNQEMVQSVQKLLDDDYQSIKEADKSIISERQGTPNSSNLKYKSTDSNQNNRNDEINNLLLDDFNSKETRVSQSLISQILTQTPSNVLKVQGLENPQINVHIIYNMFSTFGNISQVIYKNNEQCAMITYQNKEFATIAKECMNNMIFFESRLRILFSKNEDKTQVNSIQEVLMIPENHYDFEGFNEINFPSKTLKICNFHSMSLKSIKQLIEQGAKVEISNIRQCDQEKCCLLVTTGKIEDSFKITSFINNTSVNGIKTRVSFFSDV